MLASRWQAGGAPAAICPSCSTFYTAILRDLPRQTSITSVAWMQRPSRESSSRSPPWPTAPDYSPLFTDPADPPASIFFSLNLSIYNQQFFLKAGSPSGFSCLVVSTHLHQLGRSNIKTAWRNPWMAVSLRTQSRLLSCATKAISRVLYCPVRFRSFFRFSLTYLPVRYCLRVYL